MRDPRIDKLAEMLVTYSMGVQKGDHVAMNLLNPVPAFAEAAIEQVYKAGALPFVQITNSEVSRAVNRGMDEAMASCKASSCANAWIRWTARCTAMWTIMPMNPATCPARRRP